MALRPAPFRNLLTDVRLGTITQVWARWFQSVQAAINEQASGLGAVALTSQSASIAATAIPITTATAAVYRINTYVRVTTAAGVSSSIQVTLSWTDGGVVQSQSGTALTGNTTTTQESKVWIVRADENRTITYSTTYASNAASAMKYQLDIKAEKLP